MTTREEAPHMEEAMKIHYRDKGRFNLVDSNAVKSGDFEVSTHVVENTNRGGSSKWEVQFQVTPDDLGILQPDVSNPYPFGYNRDQVISLFSVADDPKGKRARLVHDKVVDLIRRGITPDTINKSLREVIIEVNGYIM